MKTHVYVRLNVGSFNEDRGDDTCFVAAVTTAPESYDGFGTFTVQILDETDGKKTRLVLINTVYLQWQTSRYSSGLYGCDLEQPEEITTLEDITNILLKRIGFLT